MLAALWAAPLRAEAPGGGPGCGAARNVLAAEAAAAAVLSVLDGRGGDAGEEGAGEENARAGEDRGWDDQGWDDQGRDDQGRDDQGQDHQGQGHRAAAAAVDELERRLDRLAAEAGPRAAPASGGPASALADPTAGSVAAYLASRRGLVAAFREEGAATARARLRDPAFVEAGRALKGLLEGGAGCGGLLAGRGGERGGAPESDAGPAGVRLAPAAEAGSLAARPRAADAVSRLATSHGSALPAADLRAGLMIILGLGLLLLALSALDPARTREDPRVACRIPARLRVRGTVQPAVIIELGRRSAKLRTEGSFLAGDRGSLETGGATVKVRVAWVTPNFAGVSFQRGIDLSRLSA